jgi:hypothetical protein
MDHGSKEIIETEVYKQPNIVVDVFPTKYKKTNYNLIIFWITVGFLAALLLYYSYKVLYIYL